MNKSQSEVNPYRISLLILTFDLRIRVTQFFFNQFFYVRIIMLQIVAKSVKPISIYSEMSYNYLTFMTFIVAHANAELYI